jgi:hypothetical protein
LSRRFEILLTGVWLALALPLTLLGYGTDIDGWQVAHAARAMWERKEYVASRTTGFPLHEILATPLVHFGSWYLSNQLSIVAGLAFLGALFALAERGHLRHPRITVPAIALHPLIIVNGSSTMDYMPAVALLLWAYFAMVERRAILCAVLVGIACGFRPSSALFMIPVLAFVLRRDRSMAVAIRMVIVSAVTAVVAYSPALLQYGIRSPYGFVPIARTTQLAKWGFYLLELFGALQTLVLGGIAVHLLRRARREGSPFLASDVFLFHVVNIATWIGVFLILPEEPSYLLPMLPSALLLLDGLADAFAMRLALGAVLSYHLVSVNLLGGASGRRSVGLSLAPGLTIADARERVFMLSYRQIASDFDAKRPTLLMFGLYWTCFDNPDWVSFDPAHSIYKQRFGQLYVSNPILEEDALRPLHDQGIQPFVWRGREWEYVRTHSTALGREVEEIDDLGSFFGARLAGNLSR